MNHIVSPWIIYFIGISSNIGNLFLDLALISGIVSIVLLILGLIFLYDPCEEDNRDSGRKILKKLYFLVPVFLIFCFLTTAIPSEKYLVAMCIADSLTENRAAGVIESGKDIHAVIKQDILDLIREIKDPNAAERKNK